MDLAPNSERAVVVAERMIATITEPPSAQLNKTIILLNSGILQRSGMGRLQVRLARELAQLGYHCLRLDFSGVGDSPRQRSSKSQYDRWVEETLTAAEYAGRELGAREIVILGNCTGGEIAVRAAMADSRITGIVALNTEGTYKIGAKPPFSYFLRARLFSLPAWIAQLQKLLGKAGRQATGAPLLIGYEPTLNEADWQKLAATSTRVFFGFSSYDPRLDTFKKVVGPIFRSAVKEGRCKIKTMYKADHLFTPEAAKLELIRALKQWLQPA